MKKAVRNAVALDLASGKYALRIVAKAKGKGSYRRKKKHRTWNDGGASSVSGASPRKIISIAAILRQFCFDAEARGHIIQ